MQKNFIPEAVLKIYREHQNANKFYIESHRVVENNGEYELAEGVPLRETTLKKLVGIANTKKDASFFSSWWLPKTLLSFEHINFKRHILWYQPSKSYQIKFTSDLTYSGTYRLPALLYFVHLDQLRIFAMKTDLKRPQLNTRLYKAPLFNGTTENAICWGSVKLKIDHIEQIDLEMDAWEHALWNSEFTLHGDYSGKYPLSKTYRSIRNTGKLYPSKGLIPTEYTIATLLQHYLS